MKTRELEKIMQEVTLTVVVLASLLMVSGLKAAMPQAYRDEWAALRPQIDENIERNRKGDYVVQVVDPTGQPVANATIEVSQMSHDFAFGCNVLLLGQLGKRNEEYERAFVKLFNLATTAFIWRDTEPEPGRFRFAADSEEVWRRPPPDRVVAFGKKHGLKLKGQPLMADHWTPAWASQDPTELKRQYREWFRQVAKRYGDDIHIFDVVNESLIVRPKPFPLHTEDLDYVGWAFAQAKELFPDKTLLELNEATHLHAQVGPKYYDLIQRMVDRGRGPESIGIQFHMLKQQEADNYLAGKTLRPTDLLKTYEKFSSFGLPLYITEVTIPSTFADGTEGESRQAEVAANLYRLWFGVPRMAGIIYWNLPDGAAWKQEGLVRGGLMDEHLREKPVYQALYQLIHREWNTQLRLQANAKGEADVRGFYGNYAITVRSGDKVQREEFYLKPGGANVHKIILK